jgi:mannose-1-phosphate guanylyltransferase/mannose-6-phosphate isomerase
MPSDHYMPFPDTFVACVKTALAATQAGYLVTFGITPTAPETGYGYIAAGQKIQGLQNISHVSKFLEKPNSETAKALLATGTHTWNSGMFVMYASDFLNELQTHAPDVYVATKKAANEAKHETDFVRLDKVVFESCPSISVDYAVFEHTTRAAVTPFKGEWSDLGSWSAVADLSASLAASQAMLDKVSSSLDTSADKHVQVNAKRNHIHADKPVALVGVDDLVVVDTDDALLITHKGNSQEVKDAMALLAKRSPDLAKHHRKVQRPWGWYDSLDLGGNHQVKRIMVKPSASISLQTHEHRAEHWVIIKGEARITLGAQVKDYQRYEHIFIPKQTKHRLQNVSQSDVELIEVQCGDYLGEDDIVRYEDVYGRVIEPK